jgi:hypothetical protein
VVPKKSCDTGISPGSPTRGRLWSPRNPVTPGCTDHDLAKTQRRRADFQVNITSKGRLSRGRLWSPRNPVTPGSLAGKAVVPKKSCDTGISHRDLPGSDLKKSCDTGISGIYPGSMSCCRSAQRGHWAARAYLLVFLLFFFQFPLLLGRKQGLLLLFPFAFVFTSTLVTHNCFSLID